MLVAFRSTGSGSDSGSGSDRSVSRTSSDVGCNTPGQRGRSRNNSMSARSRKSFGSIE